MRTATPGNCDDVSRFAAGDVSAGMVGIDDAVLGRFKPPGALRFAALRLPRSIAVFEACLNACSCCCFNLLSRVLSTSASNAYVESGEVSGGVS